MMTRAEEVVGRTLAAGRGLGFVGCFVIACLASGCQPKAQVEVVPPKEPITINLNVKIEHEIRVKVDRDLEQLFENDELF